MLTLMQICHFCHQDTALPIISCPDCYRKAVSLGKCKDLVGQTFGKLTVLSLNNIRYRWISKHKRKTPIWLCQCVCGRKVNVNHFHLIEGRARSCGCRGYLTMHAMSGTAFYEVWRSKRRCHHDTKTGASAMDISWLDFNEFKRQMYNSYQSAVVRLGEEKLKLAKISVSQYYSKDNCQWVKTGRVKPAKICLDCGKKIKRSSTRCPDCNQKFLKSNKIGFHSDVKKFFISA